MEVDGWNKSTRESQKDRVVPGTSSRMLETEIMERWNLAKTYHFYCLCLIISLQDFLLFFSLQIYGISLIGDHKGQQILYMWYLLYKILLLIFLTFP